MPRITVDGKPLDVPDKTTIFEAARTVNTTIPHYCYHPGIGIEGSCRVCQVEVQGPGKMPRRLAVSCRTLCEDGMDIFTTTPQAAGARRMVLEFLLKNHPLDCPICDKAGECTLQNFAFDTGQGRSRSLEERRALRKRVDLGDVIVFDEERCILCTRCVRFQANVLKDPQLGVVNRGPNSVIATMPAAGGDTPLHGNYQGVLADICPVGALTLEKFRFQARAWQLKQTPSICAFCSRGCNINVETFRGSIKRIRPRFNAEVNQYWMCDAGRFAFDDCNDRAARLSLPLVRTGGALEQQPYDAAIAHAAKLFTNCPRGSLLALASPFLTNEEAEAFDKLTDTLGAADRYIAPDMGGPDELLYTGDPCPNRRGLLGLGFEGAAPAKIAELAAGAQLIFLAGEYAVDLLESAPGAAEFLNHPAVPVILMERRAVDRAAVAVCLPALNAFEKRGTYTNFQGTQQKVRPSVGPPPGAHSDRETLVMLREAVLQLSPPRAAAHH